MIIGSLSAEAKSLYYDLVSAQSDLGSGDAPQPADRGDTPELATSSSELMGGSPRDEHALDPLVAALRAILISGDRYRSAISEHFDIGAIESVVLSLLSEAGQPLTPHQIGVRMLLSSGTVTAILDRLEKAGHIRRTPHPTDRRSRLIVLTALGRRVLQYSNHHLKAVVSSATEGTSTAELLHVMRRVGYLLDERTAMVREA